MARKLIKARVVVEALYDQEVEIFITVGQRADEVLERKCITKVARKVAQRGDPGLANLILHRGEVFYDNETISKGFLAL